MTGRVTWEVRPDSVCFGTFWNAVMDGIEPCSDTCRLDIVSEWNPENQHQTIRHGEAELTIRDFRTLTSAEHAARIRSWLLDIHHFEAMPRQRSPR